MFNAANAISSQTTKAMPVGLNIGHVPRNQARQIQQQYNPEEPKNLATRQQNDNASISKLPQKNTEQYNLRQIMVERAKNERIQNRTQMDSAPAAPQDIIQQRLENYGRHYSRTPKNATPMLVNNYTGVRNQPGQLAPWETPTQQERTKFFQQRDKNVSSNGSMKRKNSKANMKILNEPNNYIYDQRQGGAHINVPSGSQSFKKNQGKKGQRPNSAFKQTNQQEQMPLLPVQLLHQEIDSFLNVPCSPNQQLAQTKAGTSNQKTPATTNPSKNKNKYDINGRRNKSSKLRQNAGGANNNKQSQQSFNQKIEERYNELQKSYDQIFKCQQQQELNNYINNQQILSQINQQNQRIQQENFQKALSSPQHQPQDNRPSNNKFENNISYQIILMQSPNGQQQIPVPVTPGQSAQNVYNKQGDHSKQFTNIKPFYEKSQDSRQGTGTSNFYVSESSDEPHSPNRDLAKVASLKKKDFRLKQGSLRNIKSPSRHRIDPYRSIQNFSQSFSSPDPSFIRRNTGDAVDRLSSNDPESLERQNIQMLEQILKNSKLKNEYKLIRNQKRQQLQQANRKYSENNFDKNRLNKHYSKSILDRPNQLLVNPPHMMDYGPSIAKYLRGRPKSNSNNSLKDLSPESPNRIQNLSSVLRRKLTQPDNKSISHINSATVSQDEVFSRNCETFHRRDGTRDQQYLNSMLHSQLKPIRKNAMMTSFDSNKTKPSMQQHGQVEFAQINKDIPAGSQRPRSAYPFQKAPKSLRKTMYTKSPDMIAISANQYDFRRKRANQTTVEKQKKIPELKQISTVDKSDARSISATQNQNYISQNKQIMTPHQSSLQKIVSYESQAKQRAQSSKKQARRYTSILKSKDMQFQSRPSTTILSQNKSDEKNQSQTQKCSKRSVIEAQSKIKEVLMSNEVFKKVDQKQLTQQMMDLISKQFQTGGQYKNDKQQLKIIKKKEIKQLTGSTYKKGDPQTHSGSVFNSGKASLDFNSTQKMNQLRKLSSEKSISKQSRNARKSNSKECLKVKSKESTLNPSSNIKSPVNKQGHNFIKLTLKKQSLQLSSNPKKCKKGENEKGQTQMNKKVQIRAAQINQNRMLELANQRKHNETPRQVSIAIQQQPTDLILPNLDKDQIKQCKVVSNQPVNEQIQPNLDSKQIKQEPVSNEQMEKAILPLVLVKENASGESNELQTPLVQDDEPSIAKQSIREDTETPIAQDDQTSIAKQDVQNSRIQQAGSSTQTIQSRALYKDNIVVGNGDDVDYGPFIINLSNLEQENKGLIRDQHYQSEDLSPTKDERYLGEEISLRDEDKESTDQLSAMNTSNLNIVAMNDDDANSSKRHGDTIINITTTPQDHSLQISRQSKNGEQKQQSEEEMADDQQHQKSEDQLGQQADLEKQDLANQSSLQSSLHHQVSIDKQQELHVSDRKSMMDAVDMQDQSKQQESDEIVDSDHIRQISQFYNQVEADSEEQVRPEPESQRLYLIQGQIEQDIYDSEGNFQNRDISTVEKQSMETNAINSRIEKDESSVQTPPADNRRYLNYDQQAQQHFTDSAATMIDQQQMRGSSRSSSIVQQQPKQISAPLLIVIQTEESSQPPSEPHSQQLPDVQEEQDAEGILKEEQVKEEQEFERDWRQIREDQAMLGGSAQGEEEDQIEENKITQFFGYMTDPFTEYLQQQIDLITNNGNYEPKELEQNQAKSLVKFSMDPKEQSMKEEMSKEDNQVNSKSSSKRQKEQLKAFKISDTKFLMGTYDRRIYPRESAPGVARDFRRSGMQLEINRSSSPYGWKKPMIHLDQGGQSDVIVEGSERTLDGSDTPVSVYTCQQLQNEANELSQYPNFIFQMKVELSDFLEEHEEFFRNINSIFLQDIQQLQVLALKINEIAPTREVSHHLAFLGQRYPTLGDMSATPMLKKLDQGQPSFPKEGQHVFKVFPSKKQQLLLEGLLHQVKESLQFINLSMKQAKRQLMPPEPRVPIRQHPKRQRFKDLRKSSSKSQQFQFDANQIKALNINANKDNDDDDENSIRHKVLDKDDEILNSQNGNQYQRTSNRGQNNSQLNMEKKINSYAITGDSPRLQNEGAQKDTNIESCKSSLLNNSQVSMSANDITKQYDSQQSNVSPQLTTQSYGGGGAYNIYDTIRSQISSISLLGGWYQYKILAADQINDIEKELLLQYKLKKFLAPKLAWNKVGCCLVTAGIVKNQNYGNWCGRPRTQSVDLDRKLLLVSSENTVNNFNNLDSLNQRKMTQAKKPPIQNAIPKLSFPQRPREASFRIDRAAVQNEKQNQQDPGEQLLQEYEELLDAIQNNEEQNILREISERNQEQSSEYSSEQSRILQSTISEQSNNRLQSLFSCRRSRSSDGGHGESEQGEMLTPLPLRRSHCQLDVEGQKGEKNGMVDACVITDQSEDNEDDNDMEESFYMESQDQYGYPQRGRHVQFEHHALNEGAPQMMQCNQDQISIIEQQEEPENFDDEGNGHFQEEQHAHFHEEGECSYIDIRLPQFFNIETQAIEDYQRCKLSNLNEKLEIYEIKTLDLVQMNKTGNKRFQQLKELNKLINEKELDREEQYNKQYMDQYNSERTIVKNTLDAKFNDFMNNPKYQSNGYFIQICYEDWIQQRLLFIRENEVKELIQVQLTNVMRGMWIDNQQFQDNFFHQCQCNMETENDCDRLSLSDDCESPRYNNYHTVYKMHGNRYPLPIFETVIKQKNMNYEIFKILSQDHINKIKNKILHDSSGDHNERPHWIDARLKQMVSYVKSKSSMYDGHDATSQLSSNYQSDNSIQQTALYLYIEDLEDMGKKKIDKERKELEEQKELELQGKIEQEGQDRSKERLHSQGGVYGFRYGNKKKRGKSVHDQSKRNTGLEQHLHVEQMKVRLTNGILLDLSDNANVHFNKEECKNHKYKQRLQKEAQGLQKYYDHIKQSLRYKLVNDQVIVDLKRKPFLTEKEMEAPHGICQVSRAINQQMYKFMMSYRSAQAVQIDLGKKESSKFVNPFQAIVSKKNPPAVKLSTELKPATHNEQRNQKQKIKMRQNVFEMPQYHFHHCSVASATKREEFDYGSKCIFFKLTTKLQSLGDKVQTGQYEGFRAPHNADCWRLGCSDGQSHPLYLLFEVIHVKRKTPFDINEEMREVLQRYKRKQDCDCMRAKAVHFSEDDNDKQSQPEEDSFESMNDEVQRNYLAQTQMYITEAESNPQRAPKLLIQRTDPQSVRLKNNINELYDQSEYFHETDFVPTEHILSSEQNRWHIASEGVSQIQEPLSPFTPGKSVQTMKEAVDLAPIQSDFLRESQAGSFKLRKDGAESIQQQSEAQSLQRIQCLSQERKKELIYP